MAELKLPWSVEEEEEREEPPRRLRLPLGPRSVEPVEEPAPEKELAPGGITLEEEILRTDKPFLSLPPFGEAVARIGPEAVGVPLEPPNLIADLADTIIREGPNAVLHGVIEAGKETAVSFFDIFTVSARQALGDAAYEKMQKENPEALAEIEQAYTGGREDLLQGVRDLPNVPEPETLPGHLVSGFSQFVAGYMGFNKALKGAKIAGSAKIGKVKDFTLRFPLRPEMAAASSAAFSFDPSMPLLANLMEEWEPLGLDISNPVSEMLQKLPGDSDAEMRAKSALELFLAGRLLVGVVAGLKGARYAIMQKPKAPLKVPDELLGDIPPGEISSGRLEASIRRERIAEELSTRVTGMKGNAEFLEGEYTKAIRELDQAGAIWGETDIAALQAQFRARMGLGSPKTQLRELEDDIAAIRAKAEEKPLSPRGERELERLQDRRRLLEDEVKGIARPGLIEDGYVKYQEALEEAERLTWRRAVDLGDRLFTDRSGPLKRAMIKAGGPLGQKAMQSLALQDGATGSGQRIFVEAKKAVYGPPIGAGSLTRREQSLLHRLIGDVRDLWILFRRPGFFGPLKTRRTVEAHMKAVRNELGAERFFELEKRANVYFDTMRRQVDQLADEGIIPLAEAEVLKQFDYMPLKLLERIDPVEQIRVGTKSMSVSSSGIKHLGESAAEGLNRNSELLLEEFLVRAQGRVFRNRVGQYLHSLAVAEPTNELVRLAKPKAGNWTELSTRIGGKTEKFYMSSEMAELMHQGQTALPPELLGAISAVSLSGMTRAFATGTNVAFAVANVPRDLALIFTINHQYAPLTQSGKVYSSFLPKFALEWAQDIATVFPDAALRRGRYNDAAREGLLMNWLTHGAGTTAEVAPTSGMAIAREAKLKAMRWLGGYLAETSEIMNRLALRERAIKEGADPSTATFIARDYLDFRQGGRVTKIIDSATPYLNANALALRNTVKSGIGRKNAAILAWKMTQFGIGAAYLQWINNTYHRETMQDVPKEVLRSNFVFPLGLKFEDNKGVIRNLYFKLPADGAVTATKRIFEMMMDRVMFGIVPDEGEVKELAATMKEAFGAVGEGATALPPVARLYAQYVTDYNFWTDDRIWGGPEGIAPEQEFRTFPDRETSALATDLGRMFGVSPERGAAGMGAIFSKTNQITQAFTIAYEAMARDGVPDAINLSTTDELIKNSPMAPVIGRFISSTHPYSREQEVRERIEKETKTDRFMRERKLDEMAGRIFVEGEASTRLRLRRDAQDFIRSIEDPLERKRLADRLEGQLILDKVFSRHDDLRGKIPSKSLFLSLMRSDAETRAEVFWDYYENFDPTTPEGQSGRRAMMSIAGNLPGFSGEKFWFYFNQKKRGRE